MKLNEEEALKAVFYFLDNYYEQLKFEGIESDDIAVLLGSLTILSDNKPADRAMWNEWLEAIEVMKNEKIK